MSPKWYPVYKVKFTIALPDPDMPPGRLHHAIFVERHSDGSGYLYHVTGDITSSRGMAYQRKKRDDPSASQSFHSKELLGYTQAKSEVWDTVLSSLPTPPQQKASNPNHGGKVEPFKEKRGRHDYVFYEPGEARQPLWKCTEWVENYAIPALNQNHLIQAQESTSAVDSSAAEAEWEWDEETKSYRYWNGVQWIWEGQE